LICGLTFKENCPDIRNTKVIDYINELKEFNCEFDVVDPLADKQLAKEEYGLSIFNSFSEMNLEDYQVISFLVAHEEFKTYINQNHHLLKDKTVIDIKGLHKASTNWLVI
jgi:UDP-N-acetyl-D-galactosamine dehydrogenase